MTVKKISLAHVFVVGDSEDGPDERKLVVALGSTVFCTCQAGVRTRDQIKCQHKVSLQKALKNKSVEEVS